MRRVGDGGGIDRLVERHAEGQRIHRLGGAGARADAVVHERPQNHRGRGVEGDRRRVVSLAAVEPPVAVLVLHGVDHVAAGRHGVEAEAAAGIREREVGEGRVARGSGADRATDEQALLDPLQHGAGERGGGQGGARRKDHRAAGLQDVAPQVGDARQQLQAIDPARLPPLGRFDVNRRAMPGDLHVARHRRQDDLLADPGDGASAAAARHLVDHLVELDDRVALPVGDHGARFGPDRHHLGRGGVRRAPRRLADVGARVACGGGREAQEQPSALSFSASTPRWLRHACSLSRSRATISVGARATKFWLVSLAASAASC